MGYVIIGIIVVIAVYLIMTYNNFIKLRNAVEEAFSTMDVYLKKRWDLIPNLVEVVKGYAAHESSVLEDIVKLRNMSYDQMSSDEKIGADERLTAGLSRLIALSESYPDLKANQNYLDLNRQLSGIEDDVANSRKYYNAVVKRFNTQVSMFPSNIVAGVFSFKTARMFEAAAAERESVRVQMR